MRVIIKKITEYQGVIMDTLLTLGLNLVSLSLTIISTVVFIQNSYSQKMSRYFTACQILIINWIVCHIFDIFTTNLSVKIILSNIGYFSVCSIGTMFLTFALHYVKADITNSKIFKVIIFLPSAALFFLKITDPIFHLFFRSYQSNEVIGGNGFYITVAYNYLLLIISVCLMVGKNIKYYKERFPQIILISFSAIVPLAFNLLSLLDVFSLKYDFTPISFSITSLLIFLAIYKYEFITIPPLTVKYLMSSINEGIIVTNQKHKITYINDAVKKAFNLDDSILHKDCITAFMRIAEITNSDISKFSDLLNKNSGSLDVSVSENKYFEISKMPVCNEKRTVSEIFVFYDVSTYYMLNKKLSEKNQELTKANTQLAKMNVIEKRLAVEKERTRIAQELHDSVGHGLVSIMTLLKLSLIDKNNSNENTKKALQASELLLNDVRKCVVGIKTDTKSSISARIQDFICNYNSGNSCIEFTEMGEEKSYHGFASDIIFSIVREAVTNSIRHGNANKIEVILKFSENCIRLYIIDDGTGCDKIVPDFGLKGMKEKINSIGGNIEFSSLPDNGFSVKAHIPVEVINYD